MAAIEYSGNTNIQWKLIASLVHYAIRDDSIKTVTGQSALQRSPSAFSMLRSIS